MLEFRSRAAFAVYAAYMLLVPAMPAVAQPADPCTRTAMRSILSAFSAKLKIEMKCELSYVTNPESMCSDEEAEGLEQQQAKLYNSITAACTNPSSADSSCATTSADQYGGLMRAASNDNFVEPDPFRDKCIVTLGRAAEKLARKSTKALRRCNEKALGGDAAYGPAGPACTDGDGGPQQAITRAEDKLRDSVFRRCGGADRAAGGGDDLDPQDLGFDEVCEGGPDCVGAVSDMAQLVDCLVCSASQEVGEAATGALALPLSTLQSCRATLERRFSDLARDTINARWRCELSLLGHADAPSCPDAETVADNAYRESQTVAAVTSACAALDPQDDVGFPASCPDIGSCAAVDVSAVSGMVECLRCVTAARTDEVVSSAIPVSAFEPDVVKRDCRERIGREIVDSNSLTGRKILALDRCDRGRNCGITTDACPDQRAIDYIENSRQHATLELLTACGDQGELCAMFPESCVFIDPQDMGFPLACPDVLTCGGQPTETFIGLKDCLLCIADATAQDLHDLYSAWP